jgi:hypothetical protein
MGGVFLLSDLFDGELGAKSWNRLQLVERAWLRVQSSVLGSGFRVNCLQGKT